MWQQLLTVFITLSIGYGIPLAGNQTSAELGQSQSNTVGVFDFTLVETSCSPSKRKHIVTAFRDVHLLLEAVQNLSLSDLLFQEFFGVGWEASGSGGGFDMIVNNYQRAGDLLSYSGQPTKVQVTCESPDDPCGLGALADIKYLDTDLFRLRWCDRAFHSPFGLVHIADRKLSNKTRYLDQLESYEHTLLHEMFHVQQVGYRTAFDTTSLFPYQNNPNFSKD